MFNISDALHQRAAVEKVPLSGTFELSPVCNFSCKMCYVRKTPAQLCREGKSVIPMERWLALAEECRSAGTLFLLLTGGEPFLYPGFRELYTRLHRMGFVLYINTNGTLIDAETVEWLKQNAPGRVNITLYGSNPETYRRICGDPAGYEKALGAIRMLKQARIPVVINASMIPENEEDLEEILAVGEELELNVRMSTYMFPPVRRDREESDSRFTPRQAAEIFLRKARRQYGGKIYRDLLEQYQKQGGCFSSDDEDWGSGEDYMRCRAGRSSFWISWEGVMTACGLMDFPLRTFPLEEGFLPCWLALTDRVRTTPVLSGCAGCDKRELCRPCAAMTYAETGSAAKKAPYLCQMADHILAHVSREIHCIGSDDHETEV